MIITIDLEDDSVYVTAPVTVQYGLHDPSARPGDVPVTIKWNDAAWKLAEFRGRLAELLVIEQRYRTLVAVLPGYDDHMLCDEAHPEYDTHHPEGHHRG